MTLPAYQALGPCKCGDPTCAVVGTKIKRRSCVPDGCLVGCNSQICRNIRNQKKGKRGEYNRHKKLSGRGFTPSDEHGHIYSVEITSQDKKGKQVPRNFVEFARSEFARHAWSQAERVIPEGVQAFPALYLEPDGGGAYLVVKL